MQSVSYVLDASSSASSVLENKQSQYVDHDQKHLEVQEQFNAQIEQIFEKCFAFQKCTASDTWRLPDANELFKEYYQFKNLQELKVKLNHVKSKLNNYVIEDWSLHTRRQDPAGEIPWRLKTATNAEFVTVAWCKMYECLGRFPELIKSPKINSLHLCEAPGAFITALNHYLHTRYNENKVIFSIAAQILVAHRIFQHINTLFLYFVLLIRRRGISNAYICILFIYIAFKKFLILF